MQRLLDAMCSAVTGAAVHGAQRLPALLLLLLLLL
jgi:hypothetical protein